MFGKNHSRKIQIVFFTPIFERRVHTFESLIVPKYAVQPTATAILTFYYFFDASRPAANEKAVIRVFGSRDNADFLADMKFALGGFIVFQCISFL